ncbi:MAG: DUF3089 domain-containing protein [Bacteroidales bacterium]|jgi:hypothetical protein|nr:DUF3089 domain-containing protein [Bacteroidales bacterium]
MKHFYIIALLLVVAVGCKKNDVPINYTNDIPTDYTNGDNWLNLPSANTDEVDVFFLYPTCYFTDEGNWCGADNLNMRIEALKIREGHFGIFEGTNVYAPFYRQLSIPYIESLSNFSDAIKRVPLVDAINAFEYYLSHYNSNRPVIFASHSQGTITMMALLGYIKQTYPEVLERTIAAYLIGFSINQEFVETVAPLHFADSADDLGVIVSYNTEREGATVNPLLALPNVIAINPINWKRDTTHATKTESLGSYVRFGSNMPVTLSHFADAKLDLTRGTVITNADIEGADPWPPEVLHRYDYDLFYYNLKQNVTDRIEAWKAGVGAHKDIEE